MAGGRDLEGGVVWLRSCSGITTTLPNGVRDDPETICTFGRILGPIGMVGGMVTSCHTYYSTITVHAYLP
jgi:hypothetical protein